LSAYFGVLVRPGVFSPGCGVPVAPGSALAAPGFLNDASAPIFKTMSSAESVYYALSDD
jgi:hypothetical protein